MSIDISGVRDCTIFYAQEATPRVSNCMDRGGKINLHDKILPLGLNIVRIGIPGGFTDV